MKITFTNTTGAELEQPKPASKVIPEWYKNTVSYMNNEKKPVGNGNSAATIKRCMPVFDALVSGYIIESPADVYVSVKDGGQWFEWSDFGLIAFHPIEQAPEHPAKNRFPYPKWTNPWAISTPKGYSTLFVQPFHRESVFTILPGIVDTDQYTSPVNFPFVINDPTFEGLIPKGTPIAQVIPYKRESWTMELGTQQDLEAQAKVSKKLQSKFFDRYKTMYWNRKEYK
jgi:hypothetical protein